MTPKGSRSTLGDQDLRRLLAKWNTGASVMARTLPDVFAGWAAKSPSASAVEPGTDRLTYGELNLRANRLAHFLIRAGVGAFAQCAFLVTKFG